MFAKLLITSLTIATSVVAHPTVVRRGDVSLADWSSQNLESYWSFKMRYTNLGCSTVTGTDFYTSCCYPLGAGEALSSRPAECTPAACSAPTAASTPAPTADSTPSVQSTPTADDEDDDSDLPFCEPGQSEYDDGNDYNTNAYTVPSVVQPAPSSDNSQPAPSSDNSQPAPSSDNSQPAPTQGSDNNNSGNVNTGGFATYFYQGGNAGACGTVHSDNDLIAAIDQDRYGYDFGVQSSECGRQVHITNPANGNSVTVTIADVCPTCDNGNSIDLSVAAFQALADTSVGHMAIEWYYL